MHEDHEELLAPDTFDEPIVDIFRALLDTKLVEFRKPAPDQITPPADFRKGVQLLRATLDPLSDFRAVVIEGESDDNLEKLKAARKKRDEEHDYFDYLQQFLFWFDARVDHWAGVEDERLPKVDISYDRLNALLEQVKGLKQSLHSHTGHLDYRGVAPAKRKVPARYASEAEMLVAAAESVAAMQPGAARRSTKPPQHSA